jgi:hypothetical protein
MTRQKNIKQNISFVLAAAFFVVSVCLSAPALVYSNPSVSDEFSREKATQVDFFLKRISRQKRHQVFLRKISFSQDQLNSYLNIIYIKKNTPEVKYVKLKLNKNNYVTGTIKIKLEGKKYEQVPSFLRDIEVDASGRIECDNYRMRFIFESLKINGTGFSPEVLDEAFGAAQVDYSVRKSMFDWFDLMPGIKKIVLDDKKITIFY